MSRVYKKTLIQDYLDTFTPVELAELAVRRGHEVREFEAEVRWLNEVVEVLRQGSFRKNEEMEMYNDFRQELYSFDKVYLEDDEENIW